MLKEHLITIRRFSSGIFLLMLGVASSSCVGTGSNASSGSTNQSTQVASPQPTAPVSPEIPTEPKISHPDKNITVVDHGIIHMGPKSSTGLVKAASNDLGQGFPSIGWNSTTQDFAKKSCWIYKVYIKDERNAATSRTVRDSYETQKAFGLATSVSARYGTLSANTSVAFDQIFNSVYDGVNIASVAYTKATATIEVESLSQTGLSILKNNPNNFYNLCGDQVVSTLPLVVNASYIMSYNFGSSSENTALKIEGAVQSDFGSAAVMLNKAAQHSGLHVSINTSMLTSGYADPDNLRQAVDLLASCTKAFDEQNPSIIVGDEKLIPLRNCQSGLDTLGISTKNGFRYMVFDKIGDDGYPTANWLAGLSRDYEEKLVTTSTKDELKDIGITTTIGINNRFDKYLPQIKHEIGVYQDLILAKIRLSDIANGINNLMPEFAMNFTIYPSNDELSKIYAGQLDPAIAAQGKLIGTCLLIESSEDVDKGCAPLTESSTVIGTYLKYWKGNAGIEKDRLQRDATAKTVKALIYKDDVRREGSAYETSQLMRIAFMPARKFEVGGNRSPYVIATIPVDPTLEKEWFGGTDKFYPKQAVFVGAYQVASPNLDQVFWGDWDNYSALRSGIMGVIDYYPEILFPNPLSYARMSGGFDTVDNGGDTRCRPYEKLSYGCYYTVTIKGDVAAVPSGEENTIAMRGVVQSITDTYNPNYQANADNIFGTNEFVTLYPF